jgi:hypothetical protein
MSEYVRKQALVKWLEHEYETCSDELTGFRAFDRVKRKIQSGAFDAPDGEVQRLRAIEQAIRDFQPMKEQQAGYEALVAWLESTTQFVLKPEKEEPNHAAG